MKTIISMKKLLAIALFLCTLSAYSQTTPVTPSFRINTPVDSKDSLFYTYPFKIGGYSALYNAEFIRTNYLNKADSVLKYVTPYRFNSTTGTSTQAQINAKAASGYVDTIGTFRYGNIIYRKTSSYNASVNPYANVATGAARIIGTDRNVLGTVTLDTAFSYIPFTITRGDVLQYKTSVDLLLDWRTAFQVIPATSKRDYFVSESGNDANSGLSPALPLRTQSAAAAKSDVGNIFIMDGVYGAAEMFTGNQTGSFNFYASEKAHTGAFAALTGWAVHGTYPQCVTVTAGAVANIIEVYDRLQILPDGTFMNFVLASSVADCASRPNSYYKTGTTLTVHYATIPSGYNSILCLTGTRVELSSGATAYNIYGEGGKWYSSLHIKSTGAAGANPTVYLRDMLVVRSSGPYDVIWNEGYDFGYYGLTLKKIGSQDGFNGHKEGSGNSVKGFEINCKILDQKGQGTSGNQASSYHEDARIVRVNADYRAGVTAAIQDIGTAKVTILGCNFSGGSANNNGILRAGNLLWCENTNISGGPATYDVTVGSSATMYLRGTVFNNVRLSDGTSNIQSW